MQAQQGRAPKYGGMKLFLALFILWLIIGAWLLFRFDRDQLFFWINSQNTPFLDHFFYWITYAGTAAFIIPIFLLLYFLKYRNAYFLLLVVLCQIPSFLINQGLKFFFSAKRPAAVYADASWWHTVEGLELHHHNAFPSGHTAGAFAFFLVLSMLLNRKHKAWAIVFFTLAILVGYSRIYLSQHFFADVYFGSIEGVLTCLLGWMIAKPIIARKMPYSFG